MRGILLLICEILITVVSVLIALAYLTLLERKILGSMQIRKGPQVVGIWGMLQPFADAIKLFGKETILPTHANLMIFWIAPILSLLLALVGWGVIPFGTGRVLADLNIGVLYIFAISSLGVYAVLCSGWASNSRYPFLGALRASAQMISYEVSIGLIILGVVLITGSLNLTEIVLAQRSIYNIIPLFPACVMFFISSLAETFRPPFDLPESESELVSGYNTEYSALNFGLFFLAEYSHIIMMSFVNVLLFLGGWLPPLNWAPFVWIPEIIWLSIKVTLYVFLFVWTRASLPRIRFDQLMYLGWKSYLPLSLAYLLFLAGICIGFDWIPPFIN